MSFESVGNSKPGIVVALPRSKDFTSFNKCERRFKWLETIFNFIEDHKDHSHIDKSVPTWFICHLYSHFPHDFVCAAIEKGLHVRHVINGI